jgi:phytoene dehydrogenase-like protein
LHRYGWSRRPIIELVIPSTLATIAWRRLARMWQASSHVMPQFADGSTWDQHSETVADLIIDTVEAYAPGFKASVIARQSLSPLDLERIFGLPNGDIFHGAMTLDQIFSARPMLGFAAYRMPIVRIRAVV